MNLQKLSLKGANQLNFELNLSLYNIHTHKGVIPKPTSYAEQLFFFTHSYLVLERITLGTSLVRDSHN